jgi:hypothetical protein
VFLTIFPGIVPTTRWLFKVVIIKLPSFPLNIELSLPDLCMDHNQGQGPEDLPRLTSSYNS